MPKMPKKLIKSGKDDAKVEEESSKSQNDRKAEKTKKT